MKPQGREWTSEIEQEEAIRKTVSGDFTSIIFLGNFRIFLREQKIFAYILRLLTELNLSRLTHIFFRKSERVCVSVCVCIHLHDAQVSEIDLKQSEKDFPTFLCLLDLTFWFFPAEYLASNAKKYLPFLFLFGSSATLSQPTQEECPQFGVNQRSMTKASLSVEFTLPKYTSAHRILSITKDCICLSFSNESQEKNISIKQKTLSFIS